MSTAPSIPSPTSLTQRFFRTVGRHFVTLSCVQRLPGETEEKIFVFSGFLIETGDAWFYVTAGHILRSVRAAIVAGATFDVWRLDDQTAGNRYKGIAVPYAFDLDRWLVIEDEEFGLDYAAVPLETMYCLQLQAGNAVPIAKDAWGDHVTEHDQWALVGVPSESVGYDQRTIITGRVVVIPLEEAEEPEGAGRKAENQFYARLKDMGNVKDIDGMSGGPVFALKKVDTEWKYTVIGVQSGWYPSAQIIAACPISSFGVAIAEAVESAKASLEVPDPDAEAT